MLLDREDEYTRVQGLGKVMEISSYDVMGTIGVGLIILAYICLQLEKIKSESLLYSLLNALGAFMVIISLYFDFNFPAFIVEFFWLLISLFGIGKYLLSDTENAR